MTALACRHTVSLMAVLLTVTLVAMTISGGLGPSPDWAGFPDRLCPRIQILQRNQ
jgi:hypothetical protein